MLPVLVSQLVVVLKDTAIGYQITFVEMVRQGTVVGSSYGNYVPALIVIALLMISVELRAVGGGDEAGETPAPLQARTRTHAGAGRAGARRLASAQPSPTSSDHRSAVARADNLVPEHLTCHVRQGRAIAIVSLEPART